MTSAFQNITLHDPASLLASAESEMERIPSELLFNNPRYQKLRESWCAGMFGVGYRKLVADCRIGVNESNHRTYCDILLNAKDRYWEFQLAEVQQPGRRRGLEFRQFADGTIKSIAYSPAVGRAEGPTWLANGVNRKKVKRYSSSSALHLLLYANFPASGLEYADVTTALADCSNDFASIWVISSLHICSVFSPAALGEVPGWGSIRSIEDYYLK